MIVPFDLCDYNDTEAVIFVVRDRLSYASSVKDL
jgi:hypothetical protein